MKEKLLSVFRRVLENESLTESVSQKRNDSWDSLKHIELMVEIEEEFNISLEPDEIAEIKDFKTAEQIVSSKIG